MSMAAMLFSTHITFLSTVLCNCYDFSNFQLQNRFETNFTFDGFSHHICTIYNPFGKPDETCSEEGLAAKPESNMAACVAACVAACEIM